LTATTVGDLATRVVRWQAQHGRNHLPWQNTRDPYRVWLSEIMLQQTQVVTVLDYYARFLVRFPNVIRLAAAPLDDVLGLWSGLGYYSRARNLHNCARQVVEHFGGMFPQTAEALQSLPGIGRSTAGAIASLCFGQRVAILDGNVKRVLTRFLGFDSDLANAANEKQLWLRATELLPVQNLQTAMPRYTQGMMDLGATLCLAKKPVCQSCPLVSDCAAFKLGTPLAFPVKTRKLKRSSQSIWMLWTRTRDGLVGLQRRPTPGVWAGLYCFALFDSLEALYAAVPTRFSKTLEILPAFVHVLTHKDLHLHVVVLDLPDTAKLQFEGEWFTAAQWRALGLPAPVRKLLESD
jgi:A/G-specific adenine glycosylase